MRLASATTIGELREACRMRVCQQIGDSPDGTRWHLVDEDCRVEAAREALGTSPMGHMRDWLYVPWLPTGSCYALPCLSRGNVDCPAASEATPRRESHRTGLH
jgi:hypothetical protein